MFDNILELEEFLKNSKIAVIGLGVSNKCVIDYLYKLNSDVTVFDNREESEIDNELLDKINKYNFKKYFGKDNLSYLKDFDIIFRSPSGLPTKKEFVEAIKNGSILTTEVEQVIKLAPCTVIGVTGSKGKTTTTTIIGEVLKKHGYNVYVGGNIGTPLFDKIKDMKESDIVLLELSSFQLMNMKVSPNISLIINISPDHLDVHSSYEEYIDAKKFIYKNQSKEDILVLNYDDEYIRNFKNETLSKVRYFSEYHDLENTYLLKDNYITYNNEKIIDTRKLKIRGKHNYINICAALNTIKDYIDNSKLEDILKEFNGVEHRVEFVREINNVKWYNDSASTSPDKALGGINAFDEDVVLICGGSDKKVSYEPIAKPILDNVSKLILFGQTKNEIYNEVIKLNKDLNKDIKIYIKDTLKEVVDTAYNVSEPGEVVLFSPASASFDMFKNAYQRGREFKELVNEIKE